MLRFLSWAFTRHPDSELVFRLEFPVVDATQAIIPIHSMELELEECYLSVQRAAMVARPAPVGPLHHTNTAPMLVSRFAVGLERTLWRAPPAPVNPAPLEPLAMGLLPSAPPALQASMQPKAQPCAERVHRTRGALQGRGSVLQMWGTMIWGTF